MKYILKYAIFFVANILLAQSPETNLKFWDVDNGLSQNSVNAIIQDNNGFIWVGTSDGLNKFNGYEFKIYRNNPRDSTSLHYNNITHLAEDKNGNIWIGTAGGGVARFNPRTEVFTSYFHGSAIAKEKGRNNTLSLYVDAKNRIWHGHWSGLDKYDEKSESFVTKFSSLGLDECKYCKGVYSITEDANGYLWIGTDILGVFQYDPQTNEILKNFDGRKANDIIGIHVNSILEDVNGKLLLQHYKKGVSLIDPITGTIKKLLENNEEEVLDTSERTFIKSVDSSTVVLGSLNETLRKLKWNPYTKKYEVFKVFNNLKDYNPTCLLIDKDNSFWVGTTNRGMIYIGAESKSFKFKPSPFRDKKNNPDEVLSVLIDENDLLWMAGRNKSVAIFDLKNNAYLDIGSRKNWSLNNFQKLDVQVTAFVKDDQNNIWASTLENGLVQLRLNSNNDIEVFRKNPSSKHSEQSRYTKNYNVLYKMSNGYIACGSCFGDMFVFNPLNNELHSFYRFTKPINNDNQRTEKYKSYDLPGYCPNGITEDLDGNLIVGFQDAGLYSLNLKTKTFDEIQFLPNTLKNHSGSKNVLSLCMNNDKTLWIGTLNGVYSKNLASGISKQYSTDDLNQGNYVSNIIEDEQGNLWMSDNNGLRWLNPETEAFLTFNTLDGLEQSYFKKGAIIENEKTGTIYMAGNNGLSYFEPSEIEKNSLQPEIVLDEFITYNTTMDVFETVNGISYKSDLELPYESRDFSVRFSSLDFTNSSKIKYSYVLEGYNDNWIDIGKRRELTFTSLKHGAYRLKIKATNSDGIISPNMAILNISISTPWWLSNSALIAYLSMLLLTFYLVYRYRTSKLEAKRVRELYSMKSKLYTNVTHEFRTPITVISGVNNQLKSHFKGEMDKYFDIISRNSNDLLHLVNQLLEMRKVETSDIKVDYKQIDVVPFLRYAVQSYDSYASAEGIAVHFISPLKEIYMDTDTDKLLTIISNLLSNAIKYSVQKGDVYVQIEKQKKHLILKVTDSGIGISKEDIPKVFDRFFKGQNTSDLNVDGVGIGLALTKDLVKLLNGTIAVTSKKGVGSVFTVKLKITNSSPVESTTAIQTMETKTHIPTKPQNNSIEDGTTAISKNPSLLIIEDNVDEIDY